MNNVLTRGGGDHVQEEIPAGHVAVGVGDVSVVQYGVNLSPKYQVRHGVRGVDGGRALFLPH